MQALGYILDVSDEAIIKSSLSLRLHFACDVILNNPKRVDTWNHLFESGGERLEAPLELWMIDAERKWFGLLEWCTETPWRFDFWVPKATNLQILCEDGIASRGPSRKFLNDAFLTGYQFLGRHSAPLFLDPFQGSWTEAKGTPKPILGYPHVVRYFYASAWNPRAEIDAVVDFLKEKLKSPPRWSHTLAWILARNLKVMFDGGTEKGNPCESTSGAMQMGNPQLLLCEVLLAPL